MSKNYKANFIILIIMLLLTLLLTPFKSSLGTVNIALIYLLPVLFSGAKWGTRPALFAAAFGVLTFDYFFVPPFLSFSVEDIRYLISFAIFLSVGLIIGNLSTKLNEEIIRSLKRETRVTALYNLSRDIAAVSDLDAVMESVTNNIAATVEGQVVLFLPDKSNNLNFKAYPSNGDIKFNYNEELDIVIWVYENRQKAGKGTFNHQESSGMYLPLSVEEGILGVLAFYTEHPAINNDQILLLEAFAGLSALAINRIILTEQAREIQTFAESERLRTALFNSLSHDLRTPLASIIGAVTSLLEEDNIYTPATKHDLLLTIQQGAVRMHRFINNLLDMARLESGMLKLKKEWCDIQDIIGVAITRSSESFRSHPLKIDVEPDLPLVQADFILIEQVLNNLLDNAIKYSESESEITIIARKSDTEIIVTVADKGYKIPDEDLSKIFDKFYRLKSPLQVSGTGLGLAICKGIIKAHGGNIWAENYEGVGVRLVFTLPLENAMPTTMPLTKEGE